MRGFFRNLAAAALFGASAGALLLGAPATAGRPLPGEPSGQVAREVVFPFSKTRNLVCHELTPWDAQNGDWFGYSVATSGDWVLAGAPYDDLVGGNSGSVAAFQWSRDGWRQRDILAPKDGLRGDYFGMSVDLDGDTCVIGAPWDDDRGQRSGSVYVMRWNGEYWLQEAKLVAGDGSTDDRFGHALAIEGDRVAVGARWDDDNGIESGSVYLFERDAGEWRQTAKLIAGGGQSGDEFGFAVALSGDRLAVGAFGDGRNGRQSGAAYIYRRSGLRWLLESRLEAADPAESDCFGIAIDLDEDTCIVGAPWKEATGPRSGAAYVFRASGGPWLQRARLVPPPGPGGEYFGCSVSLAGDRALVGARFGGVEPARSGAAFAFQRAAEGWALLFPLPRTRAQPEDGFGLAVDLSPGRMIVGARTLDIGQPSTDHGLVWSYSLAPSR